MSHPKDACPDCGRAKGVEAQRCQSCAGRAARTAKHGTDSRYVRHLADGDEPCAACKRAHCVAAEKNRRAQVAARRRARQLAQAARRRCPSCGGPKSPYAEACSACSTKKGRRRSAEHGTESGYYRHLRTPDPDNGWPLTACAACLAAHAAAVRERTGGQPRTPRTPRYCPGCGAPLSRGARHCRVCAPFARAGELPPHWKRVGLIWKEAS